MALLEEKGVAFETRLYLEDPLSSDELADLQGRLGRPVGEWTRTGESAFAEAGLEKGAADQAIFAAMAAHPILMERPILVRGPAARVGRPPDEILELL